jgi:predicted ATPase
VSTPSSNAFLQFAELRPDKDRNFEEYPFNLPVVRHLNRLQFHPAVTFVIGENGSGKSTLLEAIAVAWGFNAEGGSKNFGFETRATHSSLSEHLRLSRTLGRKPTDGFFLRAETFYNAASYIEDIGALCYGEKRLHDQSHGESFWSLFMNRFFGDGLYMLDEPEAALSPSRQLSLLVRIHDLVRDGSQFIIATHSPIIMAYPDAKILEVDQDGIHEVAYEQTQHYILSKQFLDNPKRMLNELLRDDT